MPRGLMFVSNSLILRRYATTMASSKPPTKPLVVVLGATGTGKSELAIELALRFRGEVINSDAMQLYRGLPIVTNKVTQEEQRGVPHHLLGHVALDQVPWSVDVFKREAQKAIHGIRSRGNLPILVGGTHYYVDALMFKETTLDGVEFDDTAQHPILEASNEEMWKELDRVDPQMAAKWHPNDRRKIQTSLRIWLSTGRRPSELYEEQVARREAELRNQGDGDGDTWQSLLLWVNAERDALVDRLEKRVDKMLDAGLLDEVQELHKFNQEQVSMQRKIDMSTGIWQTIGYKEFEPYLKALEEDPHDQSKLDKAKRQGIEDTKVHTRVYAKYQNRWTRTQQLKKLQECGPSALNSLYVLDSTDVSLYRRNVVDPAMALTSQFLNGEERPAPKDLSEFAKDVLSNAANGKAKETQMRRTCELCGTTTVTEEAWKRHYLGRSHKRVAKKKQKLALVSTERRENTDAKRSDVSASGDEVVSIAGVFDP